MITGGLTSIGTVEHYRIDGVEEMRPFLTTVVSDSDLWMFVSSTGALTAGRVDADGALFPYATDDLIHRAAGDVGPVTVVARFTADGRDVWRPFRREPTPGCTRSIAKSAVGDRLVFEERNEAWGLLFRSTWAPSPAYGWVRTVELVDLAGAGHELEVLDGLVDVMPAGVEAPTEQIRSNLVDAYKRAELVDGGPCVVYHLESLVTDRAEPAESLRASVVWSTGFDGAEIHLSADAVAAAAGGHTLTPERRSTGRPGAYLLRGAISVAPEGSSTWSIVADTGLDHRGVLGAVSAAADPAAAELVADDVAAGSQRLEHLLAGADGFQTTADDVADAHHLSNVLFNSMRGGVFPFDHRVRRVDLAVFVSDRNRAVAERHAAWLDALPAEADVTVLRSMALDTGDEDLVRLVLEYLPLTFSRRHGDPSRPWNKFSIHVRDADGAELLAYEGNWRDIFQNWEALLRSYPAYFAHVVAKFVNASTLDGHNPYRISHDGVDWEAPDPHDPWANIGYWGDHQIVYLLRLLEGWLAHEPGAIERWLDHRVFVYADVPYDLADHEAMVDDPRATITFSDERAARVAERESTLGSDGRLVVDTTGGMLRVGLAEKLLVPALAKLSSYVAGGGIWMNTQRPEWNDANNALAGPGLSMVTLFHLRRYLDVVGRLVADRDVELTGSVASWLADVSAALSAHPRVAGDDAGRRSLLDALGRASTSHRHRLRGGDLGDATSVTADGLERFVSVAIEHLDASIELARRDDGLFQSYNLVSFPSDDTAAVDHLGPMLEGQVAALSSGVLAPERAVELVDALFASGIHRADLDTFMLYPVVDLPAFVDRNLVPDTEPWIDDDVAATLAEIVVRDDAGNVRFRAEATNAEALGAMLDRAGADPQLAAAVQDTYERVFHHASFTGRSGSMYGYEGIGSVYWHMVAKLLLAVQEAAWAASAESGADLDADLVDRYRRIRSGLGFRKDPATYGAFPTDCYSHTPAHSGAQQPGMTGQVKEEVLTRFAELGVRVADGRISLQPGLLPDAELFDGGGRIEATFTLCAVPMTVGLGDADTVTIVSNGGSACRDGHELTAEESAMVFARSGEITHVGWTIAR